MGERKRVLILILIMAISSMIVAGVTITVLYHTSFKEQQARLVETAQSQARLIEAVARFDKKYSKDYPAGPEKATLSQIIDAHENYKGFGKTGEFTLSKKEGDNIVFLLSHRHFDLDHPRPVPFDSELAEPMRMALLGRAGTVIGLDYRGEVVMAAHEPVAELGLGIVAKIDLLEIRAPFLKAGAIAGLFTVLMVLAGASLFIKITNPLIKQLKKRTVKLETMAHKMGREIEERKLVEEALRRSEEKYRNLFEHANDSIFIIDPSTRQFLDINENAAIRLGYTREELLQLTVDQIATPAAAQHNDDIIRELLNVGSVTFEHAHLLKDGTKMPVEISSRVIEYSDRQVFQSIVRDITERKRMEKALSWEADVNNALSELSRTLISASSIEDISSQILETSKKLTDSSLGYAGYIDPETGYLICPTMTRDIWERCQVKEKNIIFKTYHGLWGWVLKNRKPILTNSPSKDPRSAGIPKGHMTINRFLSAPATFGNDVVGQISLANPIRDYKRRDLTLIRRITDIYAIAIHRKRAEDALQKAHDNLEKRVEERTSDLKKSNVHLKQEIAERKRVEKELETEHQRLFSVLNKLPAYIYLLAPDHSIRFANRYFQDHFGHYEKKKCYEALRAKNEPCEDCPPFKVFETGKYQEWESTRLNDGRIYQVYAYPFTDIDGSQLALELGIDITKRKQAESEIRRLSSKLLNAQEDERRRVAFELHDELGQNLSVLKLQVGSIKRKLRKDQSALQKICETVLLEFNNTIEEVRRISAALSPSILVDLGLSSALRWLVKNFANNSKVRISIDIPDTLNVFSQEQQIAIYRIFQEILTNIGKHARATHASVDSKMKTDTAVFRVEDNGIGFDAEQIQARPGSEKGLGLTAMEERIKMLDGQFQILSREGKGTKIAFEIPVDIPA